MSDSRAEDAPRHRLREWLKGRLAQQYDAALLAGTPQRRYYESLGVPGAVIFDGYDVVDNDYFADHAAEARSHPERVRQALPGLSDPRPYLLASNRFIPRKHLDVLLRGYARYRHSTNVSRRLVLLGDGPERRHLEAIVADEDIAGDVTFAGFRQIDEIPAYFAFADAFVHTAQADQWALVVNEAMACGLPVVVSRGTGCAEDLVDGTGAGLLFDTGDPYSLAQALRQIHDADLPAMARAATACISHWNLDRFTDGMLKAVQAGAPRANRGLDPLVRLMLYVLSRTSSLTSLHTVEA